MKKLRSRLFVVTGLCALFAVVIVLNACKHHPGVQPDGGSGYPEAVAKILVNKCATAGCHNPLSYQNSDGVLLDTWQHLFDGGNSGAVVVPYDIENSSLLSFINTDSTDGLVQEPHMPLYQAPLSKEEYHTIRDWIAAGAPDKAGNIPFGDNPDTRQKIYLTTQGSDMLHVIDAQRNVIMRNIKIGKSSDIEAPHCVRVSEDGLYAYTCFLKGGWAQKIDTRTDKIVGEVYLSSPGVSQYNILNVSRDGSRFIVADFAKDSLLIVNTATMQIVQKIWGAQAGLSLSSPHGMASNAAFDTIYVTSQYGNTIYKISPGGYLEDVSLDGNPPNNALGTRDPHEIMLTPDDKRLFVTCQASNEVRVLDAHTNAVLAAIPTPTFPQELAISRTMPYIFATCMEATSTLDSFRKGAVLVINYNTLQVVKTIYGDFYQPHGITVDDRLGKVFIASSNQNLNGPAPHHVLTGGGRIGWYSVYDLNTLLPVNSRRYETSIYPYSADVRFK